MNNFVQDLRCGFRALWTVPRFSVIALFTLVLGIGANTLIFTILDALFFQSAFTDPGHLVVISNRYPNITSAPTSYPDFLFWKQQNVNQGRSPEGHQLPGRTPHLKQAIASTPQDRLKAAASRSLR